MLDLTKESEEIVDDIINKIYFEIDKSDLFIQHNTHDDQEIIISQYKSIVNKLSIKLSIQYVEGLLIVCPEEDEFYDRGLLLAYLPNKNHTKLNQILDILKKK